MTLEDIQKEMEFGKLLPPRMAELRSILSGKYTRSRDIWDDLESQRFIFINAKEEEMSEAARDREWNGTNEGKEWRKWKSQMRKIDRMLNALSSQIRVAEGEAHNLW